MYPLSGMQVLVSAMGWIMVILLGASQLFSVGVARDVLREGGRYSVTDVLRASACGFAVIIVLLAMRYGMHKPMAAASVICFVTICAMQCSIFHAQRKSTEVRAARIAP